LREGLHRLRRVRVNSALSPEYSCTCGTTEVVP
jgi:hypothetical protein